MLSTQTGQWCRVCHEQYLLSFALRYTVGQSCSITSLSVGGWRSDNLRLVSELSRLFYWICRKSQVGNNVLNHSRFYHILAVLWENDEWCLQIARTSSRHWCNLPLVVTWKVWWASKECWFGDSTDVTWGVSSKTHHCSTWAALSQLCLHDVIWRGWHHIQNFNIFNHAMMQRMYAPLDVDQRGQWCLTVRQALTPCFSLWWPPGKSR